MARCGKKFPEETRTHGAQSPGIVEDDEYLERRLPPTRARETSDGAIPQTAFPRRELQWTVTEGGASVDRIQYAQGGIAGRRGTRGTIGDIRRLTDAKGNRLWSITDQPVQGNLAHAEIQREPRGKLPSKAERTQLVEIWRGAVELLAVLKGKDPQGKPELRLVPDIGVAIHWRSGQDNSVERVVQVESVAEAVRAYIGAGLVTKADAVETQRRLEQELVQGM